VELGGHRACKIRLTPLGELWQQSQPRVVDAEPMGEDTRRELLAEGRRIARSMVLACQAPPAAGISGEQEMLVFVREMVGKFRHWVEDEGGWKVLWEGKPDEARVMPEPKMQLIFLGVLGNHFKKAGLRLGREVETGRGPVGLTVTGTGACACSSKRLSRTDSLAGPSGQALNLHAGGSRACDMPGSPRLWHPGREEALGDAAGRTDTRRGSGRRWRTTPCPEKNYVPTRSQRARSVLTCFAQDSGTHDLVYASADHTKATQNREKPSRRC
jgi:hypothetical protein